jgi:hypothetical protein
MMISMALRAMDLCFRDNCRNWLGPHSDAGRDVELDSAPGGGGGAGTEMRRQSVPLRGGIT